MAASSSASTTAAGPKVWSKTAKPTAKHADAISQMFVEFELAYHNQFHKAFGTQEQVMMAQQLWLDALADIDPEHLRLGARRAIKESKFLPNLHALREFCVPSPEDLGLPSAHAAYVEACRAPSPKTDYNWSHPAVYLAGRASDWFFLASNIESRALPVFKHNYEQLCERVMKGEQLDLPIAKALPAEINTPLSNEERKEKMRQLRADLGI